MADEPIDLAAERNKREEPAPENVLVDDFGRKLYRFLCSYDLGPERYIFHLWAYDLEDADKKIQAIKESGQVDGQVFHTVPEWCR